MDPYRSPKEPDSSETALVPETQKLGPPCKQCGSNNTTANSFFRPKLSIIAIIFFGWYYLLIRGAFSTRTSTCRDCGAETRYKSTRSWIALMLLILIVLLIGSAVLQEYL